ncbi:MAG TPA: hypothetical protein VME20_05495 [Acidimicrobiales bacterium]|nr:hypothetical protein [Acidimicrobiales bacterium]HUB69192.1 hypothetical protein [Acidimicrobiales bacterium]
MTSQPPLLSKISGPSPATCTSLLYTDHIGRQRTIPRFRLLPANWTWIASLTRHWYLDWEGPRPENLVRAANDAVMRDHEAAQRREGERRGPSGDPHASAGCP